MEMAWAAGFVDGEGCICIARQTYKDRPNVSHRLKLTVTQNNYEVLSELQGIIGEPSFISMLTRTEKMNRNSYALVYDSKHALSAIRKLKPFLRRKQFEADAAEKMWEEGMMGKRPGMKGWPPEVYQTREKWARKITRLK
ncbi:MAG: endonuclease [Methylophaga sp.]|nr:endonuclease [Methylophaga sp.]